MLQSAHCVRKVHLAEDSRIAAAQENCASLSMVRPARRRVGCRSPGWRRLMSLTPRHSTVRGFISQISFAEAFRRIRRQRHSSGSSGAISDLSPLSGVGWLFAISHSPPGRKVLSFKALRKTCLGGVKCDDASSSRLWVARRYGRLHPVRNRTKVQSGLDSSLLDHPVTLTTGHLPKHSKRACAGLA
jgi:hypothetical protein